MESPMTMTTTHSRPAVVSPRVPEPTLARYPAATRAPQPHTAAELDRLIRMLRASRAETIAIGHGRHTASAGAADALAAAWTAGAGQVLAVVDWPAAAASWLRPAQRLAGSQPDAWILADTPAGCAQLASRLTGQPGWTPGRTFGFASVATPDLLALTPPGALAGMTGATAAGGSWRIGQGLLLVNDDPEGATP
jgi:substrate-binding family protein